MQTIMQSRSIALFFITLSFLYFAGCDRQNARRSTTDSVSGAIAPTYNPGFVYYTATPTQYNGNSCVNVSWSSCYNGKKDKYCNGVKTNQTEDCSSGSATATPTYTPNATASATNTPTPTATPSTPSKIAVRSLLDSLPLTNQVAFDTATIGKKGSCNFAEFQNLHTPERIFLNSKGCSPNSYVLCVKHRSGDIVDIGRDYVGIPGIADNGNNEYSRSYTVVRDGPTVVSAMYEICLTDQEYETHFKNFSGELKLETKVSPEQGIIRHIYGDWCDRNRRSNNQARWDCRTSWENIPKATIVNITRVNGAYETTTILDFPTSNSTNTKKLTFYSGLETTRSNDNGNYGCEVRCAGNSKWNGALCIIDWKKPLGGAGWAPNDNWYWQVGRADDGLPVCAKWAKSERCRAQSCPTGNIYIDVNRQPWCIEATVNGIHRVWKAGYPAIEGIICNKF
ncbi:MAG: hypothetical protein QE271_14490 [Bacteriovoracaceae bacterium]|nr:hypothetical protein [Bacteriovoracaceae bacterium]